MDKPNDKINSSLAKRLSLKSDLYGYKKREVILPGRDYFGELVAVKAYEESSKPEVIKHDIEIPSNEQIQKVVSTNKVKQTKPESSKTDSTESEKLQDLYDSFGIVRVNLIENDYISRVRSRKKIKKEASRYNFDFHFPRIKINPYAIMGSIVFVLGVAVSINGFRINKKVEAEVSAVSQNQNTDDNLTNGGIDDGVVPVETPVTTGQIRAYKPVTPDMPRYVRVLKYGIEGRVIRVGINSLGVLKAPGNIYDAGWYDGSAKPGQNGAVLIDAHVHGPTTSGLFYHLSKMVIGDEIEVERGDGQKFHYVVEKTKVYDENKVDMASAITPIVAGKQGLNLITCTGKIVGTDYKQRLLVYASRID